MLSAVPYLTSWWAGIFFSIFADWLLLKGYISLSLSYKLWNSVGAYFSIVLITIYRKKPRILASVIPSLGLLGVAYVGCNKYAAQLLLAIPGAFGGATYAGNQMNHISLSPKYAGTMYGITNAASNMCGFLAPYVIGLLINGRVCIFENRLFV